MRRASPGAASAAASAQTRRVSPVRPPSQRNRFLQALSDVSATAATRIKESDAVRVPQLPRVAQLKG
eukprot:7852208-Pyramimonas_sp.AAC.1